MREVKEAAGQGQDPGLGVWRAVRAPSAACIRGGQVRKQKGRDWDQRLGGNPGHTAPWERLGAGRTRGRRGCLGSRHGGDLEGTGREGDSGSSAPGTPAGRHWPPELSSEGHPAGRKHPHLCRLSGEKATTQGAPFPAESFAGLLHISGCDTRGQRVLLWLHGVKDPSMGRKRSFSATAGYVPGPKCRGGEGQRAHCLATLP